MPPTKTIIAYIWLALGGLAVVMLAIPYFGQTSAHRYYYMTAIEYDTKVKFFPNMEDEEVIQSFVEGDDPNGYTYLGFLLVGKFPHTRYALFNPWVSSVGVSQIYFNYNGSTQTLFTHSQLSQILLTEAALNLNSSDPYWEFERMESSGFLNLIANNPMPVTKFHPGNIAADLLTLVFIAGALTSMAYLIKQRIRTVQINETARCPNCGYPRTGLASITQCPECGHHFAIRTSENSI